MNTAIIVIGVLLIIMSLFLIVAVLLQQGKNHNLSGTIAGGAETFFGKSKAQTMNKKLSVLTTVVAIVFVVLVIAVYCMQTSNEKNDIGALVGGNEVVTEAPHDHDHDHDHEETKAETTAETEHDHDHEEETTVETTAETTAA